MKKICLLVVCIIAAIISKSISAQSAELLPSTVRVGIHFDNSARNLYQLSSNGGFKVMLSDGQEKFTVMTFSDRLVEVFTDDLNNFTCLRDNFKDIQSALEFVSILDRQGSDIFLLYDESWAVFAKTDASKITSNDIYLAVKGNSSNPGLLIPFKTQQPVFFISTSSDGLIAVEGRRYRGMLKLTPAGGRNIQVVNELGLQEYLYGVVPLEISPSWHEEVLKAQAVAARTYAIANMSKWGKYGFDVCANSGDQLYGGYDVENVRTNKAIDETEGQIIIYNDKPIMAFYHADSGGRTEACKDVFSIDLPYLQSVDEIFYENSPHSEWKEILSLKDISNCVNSAIQNIGEIRQISVLERSQTGRVTKLLLKGSISEVVLEKGQIRSVLGLKSNLFDILEEETFSLVAVSGENVKKSIQLNDKNIITSQGQSPFSGREAFLLAAETSKSIKYDGPDGIYTFQGRGYGHGVGMSQWGAKTMAEKGYNYVDILLHYYKNTQIKNIAEVY